MLKQDIANMARAAAQEAIRELGTDRKSIFGNASQTEAFPIHRMAGNDDFPTFATFLKTVKNNPNDTRLKAGLAEDVGSSGGFTVPTQFSNQILALAAENSVVRPYATIVPMEREELVIPRIDDTDHTSSLWGNVICYWEKEGESHTVKEPKFALTRLKAKKLVGYTYCSNEWLEDTGISGETLLTRAFTEAIRFYEDYAYLQGTGVGEPLGVLNSAPLITVDAVGGQGAGTIIAENIIDMWSRLLPGSHSRAVWIANPAVVPELYTMAIAVGAGGVPVWMPANTLANQPYQSLMGRPLLFTEKLPTIGTAGDIMLCDLSYYLIGDRRQLRVDASEHLRFLNDQTAFRFTIRTDGMPWPSAPLTPKAGDTLSPFIVLNSTRT